MDVGSSYTGMWPNWSGHRDHVISMCSVCGLVSCIISLYSVFLWPNSPCNIPVSNPKKKMFHNVGLAPRFSEVLSSPDLDPALVY